MKKFMLFVLSLIAIFILLANLGPMVFLGLCIYLLYIIFKKFIKAESIVAKVAWVLIGLLVLSMATSNLYAIIGLVAAYFLYTLYKNWNDNNREEEIIFNKTSASDDPFTNFERQRGAIK
ncbi:lia operon protein LiaI [Evansella vedderi]|uniref:Lia operon protein LiaI n=1 Tax=Evansella vedderi TaxID=38282 RepID=A0ABT9ZZ24_9BACI|nr:flagellar basal body rod protein [Evansella vedderi]MDQ0256499.1 lia operon protein LiaI [Evansella vedderi]